MSITTGHRQRGVALITALLVVALAVLLAVELTEAQSLATRRTANLLHADQAHAHALGIEAWARSALARDWETDTSGAARVDSVADVWAAPLALTGVEGGSVRGHTEDLQARYNLNNLAFQEGEGHLHLLYLRRLLTALGLEPGLADAIADWVDSDLDTRFPDGAEDLKYLRAKPPYRAGNGPMAALDELLLVDGVTGEVFARLAPYVTALPEITTINVNTASEPVLAALDVAVADRLRDILEQREREPFAHVPAFLAAAGVQGAAGGEAVAPIGAPESADAETPAPPPGSPPGRADLFATLVGVSSDYFLVHGDARVGAVQVRLASVISRAGDGAPQVIARTRRSY